MSEKMSGYMSCETFEKNLNAFLDGELDDILRAQMMGHTKTCPTCSEKLEQMTRLLGICAEMDEDVVLPLAGQAAWRAAIQETSNAKNRPRASSWLRSVGMVAAALVFLIAGTIGYRIQSPRSLNDYGVMGSPMMKAQVNESLGYVAYDGGGQLAGGGLQRSFAPSTEIDGPEDITEEDAVAAQNSVSLANGSETDGRSKPVVLRSAVREIETTSFDADLLNLQDLVNEYEGDYKQSTISGQPIVSGETSGRTARMITRIPSELLSEFLKSLAVIGKTVYASESADDISSQYYDVQTRLDTYRAQQKRLQELIQSAQSMEDLIALEDKLYDVQNSIDSLEGQLRGWNSQVSYSSVTISIQEVAARDMVQPIGDTLGDRMRMGFYDSVNWLVGFLQDMFVMLVIIAPQLVIIIPAIVLVVVIVRTIRRRKK